jgi:hypothetical protein
MMLIIPIPPTIRETAAIPASRNVKLLPVASRVCRKYQQMYLLRFRGYCGMLDVHVLIDDIIITGDDVPDGGSPVQIEGDVKSGGKLATTWGGMKFHVFNGY